MAVMGSKFSVNVGTLMRSAYIYGIDEIVTIGARYKRMATDTCNTVKHVPIIEKKGINGDWLRYAEEKNLTIVAIECPQGDEIETIPLYEYEHPERAMYLLGAEDRGLSDHILRCCDAAVKIPSTRPYSLNVAVAGTLALYDRYVKLSSKYLYQEYIRSATTQRR